MHGGLLIFLWLCLVALMQGLPLQWLAALLCALGVACACLAQQRAVRLLRRVRVLLAAIFVLFAWFTPGVLVVVDWPAISPTREGLLLAFEHAGRVVAVVLCVALLMATLSPSRLVGAIYALLRPFEVIGVPAARIAVRTLLVLEYVEGRPEGGWRHWLSSAETPTPHRSVCMPVERFGLRDWLVLVIGLLLLIGGWYLR